MGSSKNVIQVLNAPLTQESLRSTIPAQLTCIGYDGFPSQRAFKMFTANYLRKRFPRQGGIGMASLQSVNVDGVELSFVERGSGRSVIFVHGIPTDYRAWDAQVDALSKGFHMISYSRRCAYPNKRKDFENSTIENNVKDLAGLIKRVDDGPVDLVGHSYGGFVALYCAVQHPELVRSLVLVVPYIPTLIIRNLDSALDRLSLLVRMPSVALSARRLLSSAVYPALKGA